MRITIDSPFEIGDHIEARNSWYGGEFEPAVIIKISFVASKDGKELIYKVRNLKYKNYFNANSHNVRYEKLG